MINDFSDNYFFNTLDEAEQYAMASMISERMRLSIGNKEFKFTENTSSIQKGTNRTIKNYVFKYEITNDRVKPLRKLPEIDIREEESFYENLEDVYKYSEIGSSSYIMDSYRNHVTEFIEDFKEVDFLKKIPFTERKEIIIYIIQFGAGYYREQDYIPFDKRKLSTAIKRDSEKIQKFQDFIKKFLPEKNTKPYLKGTTFDGKDYLEDINNRLDVLKLDLENKDFKIFSKLYYEGSEALTKNDLEDFLKTKAKKYNLACTTDIRELRERMPKKI